MLMYHFLTPQSATTCTGATGTNRLSHNLLSFYTIIIDQLETNWFQPRRQMGCRHCTVGDVIDSKMTLYNYIKFSAQI